MLIPWDPRMIEWPSPVEDVWDFRAGNASFRKNLSPTLIETIKPEMAISRIENIT